MPLAHSLIAHEGASPARLAAFLHGLLGQGSNFQSFARRLTAARPEYAALLLDLPQHGGSRDAPPPYTVAESARRVRAALEDAPMPVHAVIGHSFGGKVAMRLLADPPPDLRELWVLDASPSARSERPASDTTARVVAALRALPPRLASRAEFTAELAKRGIDTALALWLAKNLARDGDALRFALDLDAIAQLFADYDREDLWPLIEAPPPGVALRFVLGGKSQALAPLDRERLGAAAARGALALFELPEAGHWLHADDPEGLAAILAQNLQ